MASSCWSRLSPYGVQSGVMQYIAEILQLPQYAGLVRRPIESRWQRCATTRGFATTFYQKIGVSKDGFDRWLETIGIRDEHWAIYHVSGGRADDLLKAVSASDQVSLYLSESDVHDQAMAHLDAEEPTRTTSRQRTDYGSRFTASYKPKSDSVFSTLRAHESRTLWCRCCCTWGKQTRCIGLAFRGPI